MGVIFKVGDDINALLIPYLRKLDPKISADKVHELYALGRVGKISSAQFFKELGFGNRYPAIEKDYLDQCLEVDPGFYPCARALKPRYHLSMLSNDLKEWSQYLRAKNNLNDFLEVAVISGEAGVRKPEPAIYQALLKRISAQASQCFFVDDRPPNLATAREMGFQVAMFSRIPGEDTGDYPVVRSFHEIEGLIKGN